MFSGITRSIGKRLSVYLFAAGIVFCVLMYVFVSYSVRYLFDFMLASQIRGETSLIANEVMSGYVVDDSRGLLSYIQSLQKSNSHIVAVSVVRPDLSISADSDIDAVDGMLSDSLAKTAMEEKSLRYTLRQEGGRDLCVAYIPLVRGENVLGALKLSYHLSQLADLQRRIRHYKNAGIVFFAILIILFAVAGSFIIKRQITQPLAAVITTVSAIAEGNLSQRALKVSRHDEIGQLSEAFNKMTKSLGDLVHRAESIAAGDIGVGEVEGRMKSGMSLETAAAIEEGRGDLAASFARMQAELRKLAVQAREIAMDDLNNPLLDVRIPGELGEAFSQMTANLKGLAHVAQRLASHDLTVTVSADSKRNVLAAAFSQMVGNLKELIGTINRLAGETQRSSTEMAQTTEESNHTMAEVQNSIQQVAAATAQVSKSVQEIVVLVQNTNTVAEDGSRNIGQVIEKFELLQQTIVTTGGMIAKLDQRSREISEIVGLITKIADQTNLLALNAAIEAARAGEAGKGFAVVAVEVKKLAESSGESAAGISKIIKEIQQDTAGVVSSSRVSLEEAKRMVEMTNRMHSVFSEIVEAIHGISRQVEHIAAVAEETAASSEEISSGVEQQTAAIEEMTANAQVLLQHSTSLKEEVNRFKV